MSLATQWFIVSDLGLTAFSGNDGIHVFVNSLATTEPKSGIELRLDFARQRGAGHAPHRRQRASAVRSRAWRAGRAAPHPRLLAAIDPGGDYAFLNLKAPAFDLTDRGVGGRPAPNGLDAFVYAERGVYRSGETAYLTALAARPAGRRGARRAADLRGPAARRRRIPPHRWSPTRVWAATRLMLALPASAPTGTWHVQAFTDPKRPPVGETTFLVEDYVPDRIEFDLTSPTERISQNSPGQDRCRRALPLWRAGRRPRSRRRHDDRGGAKSARASPAISSVSTTKKSRPCSSRSTICRRPTTPGKANFTVSLDKLPSSTHPLEAQIAVRMAEPGGRAVEHKITLPVTASGNMIGVKPLFSGRSLADGANATFDVVVVAPDGRRSTQRGLHYELLRIDTHYQFYKRDGRWNYEPVKTTKRVADGTIDTTLDKPAHIALPVNFGRYRLEVSTADPNGPVTSVDFDAGCYVEANADTPDMLEVALDKPEYKPGDTMTVAVTARSAGRLTLNVIGDRLLASQTIDVQAGRWRR